MSADASNATDLARELQRALAGIGQGRGAEATEAELRAKIAELEAELQRWREYGKDLETSMHRALKYLAWARETLAELDTALYQAPTRPE